MRRRPDPYAAGEVGFKPDLAPGGFALSEAGAADSFGAAHADDVRFDFRRNRWVVRQAHRWAPDTTAAVTRLVRAHVRREQHRALDLKDSFARARTLEHWMRFDRRTGIDNLLAIAKTLEPIADAGDGWDADPMLLGCENGVIDLRAGTLRPGRPSDRITMSTSVPFDPDARCPRWERFVAEVLPDPAVADFMWRALGYSISGDVRERLFFLLCGRGHNGKSTLVDTIESLLGDYAQTVPFATFEQDRSGSLAPDVATLDGKRWIKASEGSGRWLHSSRLKDITGGERISARHLYGNPFTFRPVCKIFLSTNALPRVDDDSDGLWDRLRQVPFTQRFDGASDDKTLKQTLHAEAPGILAWLVRGCLEWQDRGLEAPAAVAAATSEYRVESDVLNDFLAEACDVEPAAEVRASDLYQHYRLWAARAGMTDREWMKATAFGRKVGERFRREHRRSGWVYLGVARGNV